MIIVTVVLVALIIPLVIGSVFVCVPKWWTKSVEPRIPDWMIIDLPPPSEAATARIGMALTILVAPFIFSVALVVWLIRGWFVIGLAVIEGVCPYNGGFTWRNCLSEWFDAGRTPLTELHPDDILGS